MRQIIVLLVFVVFSLVFVDVAPAPPLPGGGAAAPVGGAVPSGITIVAIAIYGFFRMRK